MLDETTFFSRPKGSSADFALRSLLPNGHDVFGAGHNILGVSWHLANAGFLDLARQPDESDEQAGKKTSVFRRLLGGERSDVQVTRVQMPNGQRQSRLSISLQQSQPVLQFSNAMEALKHSGSLSHNPDMARIQGAICSYPHSSIDI